MFSFLTSRHANAFGLDLSPSGIKFVQLRAHGKQTFIDLAGGFPFPEEAIANGRITNPVLLASHLKAALEPFQRRLSVNVVTSLPESITFLQCLSVPKSGETPFLDRLRDILPQYLPMSIEETIFDASIVSETADSWSVVVGAAPRDAVETYLDILQGAGLTPVALDVEAPSIVRAALIESDEHTPTTAIIDLGRSHAALMYIDRGVIQFTVGLPAGGESIVADAAIALHQSPQETEQAIRDCGENPDRCPAPLSAIIEKTSSILAAKISEAEVFYADHNPAAHAIEQIILCGGGAQLGLLLHDLQSKFSLPVTPANPWNGISGTPPPSPLGYTTAIGLARRALALK